MNCLNVVKADLNWHSGLPIFASERYLKAAGDDYGWIGGTDNTGKLHCVLPYIIIRKAGICFVRFRTETIPVEGELDVGEEKAFLKRAMEFFRSAGGDVVIPPANTALFRTYPDGAVAAPYGTFVIQLNQPEELLFSGVHTDYRKKTRRAVKAGVLIKSGIEYLDICYRIVADTLKRSGSKLKDYDEFRRNVLSLGENVRISVADYKGSIQACLVCPFSEYSAYSWYGGTVSEPLPGAMHLLHWEAIRQFNEMGVKRFNFTGIRINPEKGSKQEGIMTFKMRFGGSLVQGFMWKYALRPLKFAAYCLGMRLLKGGDIVDREHHKLALS